MKTRGFTFNFTPLTVSHGITLVGTVPDEQNYSSYDKAYTPDYKVTPLSLLPWVNIVDKDGVLTSGNVNAQLANITWQEIKGETTTTITNDTEGYSVLTTGGSQRGKLIMSKNIDPDTTITLKFSADYVDSRTNQTFRIQDSYLLSCYSAAQERTSLSLSIADASLYNPLRDVDNAVINASMYLGSKGEITSDTTFVWQLSNDGETFHTACSDILDYWASVSGSQLTVNRQKMGETVRVRCYGLYGEDSISEATPYKTITITRRIPYYDSEIQGGAGRLSPTQDSVDLTLNVFDKQGDIDGYEKELMALWYVGATGSDGNASVTTFLGEGTNMTVLSSQMSKSYGAVVGVDIKDRGALKAAVTTDGKILTDGDGKILLIH